jgi:hypothetical protein
LDKQKAVNHLEEAQRLAGNLHATVANFCNSESVIINDNVQTKDDLARYVDDQVRLIQNSLRSAVRELNN